MCAARGGEYRRQDWQAIFHLRETRGQVAKESRAQQQWHDRAPAEYEEYPIRMAWRQAEPIDAYGDTSYARRHPEAGMIILAKWGFIYTAFPEEWDADGDYTANHGDSETVRLDDR